MNTSPPPSNQDKLIPGISPNMKVKDFEPLHTYDHGYNPTCDFGNIFTCLGEFTRIARMRHVGSATPARCGPRLLLRGGRPRAQVSGQDGARARARARA